MTKDMPIGNDETREVELDGGPLLFSPERPKWIAGQLGMHERRILWIIRKRGLIQQEEIQQKFSDHSIYIKSILSVQDEGLVEIERIKTDSLCAPCYMCSLTELGGKVVAILEEMIKNSGAKPCQTCGLKPGKPRIDMGLSAGEHCDECWEDVVALSRDKSW